jgi:hypothetical protein
MIYFYQEKKGLLFTIRNYRIQEKLIREQQAPFGCSFFWNNC